MQHSLLPLIQSKRLKWIHMNKEKKTKGEFGKGVEEEVSAHERHEWSINDKYYNIYID